jgi:ketosteroid isomerase-like protein
MKTILIALVLLAASICATAQNDLEKLAATERSFAALAAEKGTKQAFLENASSDAVLFIPDRINAKEYWNARGESKGLLSWDPNYADVSSNGLLGYTTGNWEYRSAGKGGTPEAFGNFITIWQRQPDGKYKFVVDIGVSHDKPAAYSTALAPPAYPSSSNERNTSAADTANSFFEVIGKNGLSAAYKTYAAKEIRSFRENTMPMIGKSELLSYIKKTKGTTRLTKRATFLGSADIAYIVNTYTRTSEDGKAEKGNFMQIWKLIDGRWQIVLDIFKPVPEK